MPAFVVCSLLRRFDRRLNGKTRWPVLREDVLAQRAQMLYNSKEF